MRVDHLDGFLHGPHDLYTALQPPILFPQGADDPRTWLDRQQGRQGGTWVEGNPLLLKVGGQLVEGGGVEDACVDQQGFHGVAGSRVVTLGISD